MSTEPSDLATRARIHAALGEPARLAIVERLLLSDASPTELGRELGLASNLTAHHLGLLEQCGLISRTRSHADHRRTYVSLVPGALERLEPEASQPAARVVFVCTANSARSPLAEALWRRHSHVPASSAGTHPADHLHPATIAAAQRHGLRLSSHRTRALDHTVRPGDLVVAVCDQAYESTSVTRTEPRLHWSVPDPENDATDAAFDAVVAELAERVERLANAVRPSRQ